MPDVQGYCPMGCGKTLMLGTGGHITCRNIPCPNPTAVDSILGWPEHEHIVTFGDTDFSILHPLRERLNHELVNCELHKFCHSLAGPPVRPGRYRARRSGDRWTWEALDHSEPVMPPLAPGRGAPRAPAAYGPGQQPPSRTASGG